MHAKTCDKQCGLVFHLTDYRHRTDCSAYEPEPLALALALDPTTVAIEQATAEREQLRAEVTRLRGLIADACGELDDAGGEFAIRRAAEIREEAFGKDPS